MKQGKPVITFVMIALATALAIYFGCHVFNTFNDPFSTTLAYAYTVNDSVEADGLLVRQEEVFPAQEGIVDVVRSEGEKVGVGQTVAHVYRDSQAQSDQAQLEALRMEIELLEHAAVQGGDVESAARLDEDILQSVVELRYTSALGSYAELEDQVKAVKSGVLKRGFLYGDKLNAADLAVRLKSLKEEYAGFSGQTAVATTKVRTGQSGVFSNLVDGCESRLTPQTVFDLTVSDLKSITVGTGAGDGIGKLITSPRWYFAAALPAEAADRLKEGKNATLRFSGDFVQDVSMRVEQIGAKEGDTCVVVFSTDRYLNQTTLLRRQTAELIFDSWSGIRVPKEALRMEKYTYTETVVDEKTGKEERVEKEGSRLGVYALVGGRSEFKPAEIVVEGTDYYVLRATSNDSKALRAGDEIITRAVGLHDGQLLEF